MTVEGFYATLALQTVVDGSDVLLFLSNLSYVVFESSNHEDKNKH